ncbi:unnamed protein product [Ectocarpus sp. 8 AP-2014]
MPPNDRIDPFFFCNTAVLVMCKRLQSLVSILAGGHELRTRTSILWATKLLYSLFRALKIRIFTD